MTTQAQITANQLNSQKSTGPTSPAGLERSSQNATKHGLTAQTLVISPEERESYLQHVQSYMDLYQPVHQFHRQLVQQFADSHWSLHQVFVQQTNLMSLMNAINIQVSAEGDPQATAAALAPLTRQLNTLSIYEGRRRRASKFIQQELEELAQRLAEADRAANVPNSNQTNDQPTIGSVCSTNVAAEWEAAMKLLDAQEAALLRQCESEVTPAEAAAIRRQAAKLNRK